MTITGACILYDLGRLCPYFPPITSVRETLIQEQRVKTAIRGTLCGLSTMTRIGRVCSRFGWCLFERYGKSSQNLEVPRNSRQALALVARLKDQGGPSYTSIEGLSLQIRVPQRHVCMIEGSCSGILKTTQSCMTFSTRSQMASEGTKSALTPVHIVTSSTDTFLRPLVSQCSTFLTTTLV